MDPNRFSLPGLAAVAQIEALQTSNSPDKRLAARLILARKLVEWGLDRKQLSIALRLVSWMMKLPKRETLQFREKFLEFESMTTTNPLTDLEEILIEEHKEEWLNEGLEKGRQEGLEKGLEKGREEGREKGEWIGKILLLEDLMGRQTTPRDQFADDTVGELKAKFRELEKEYFRATR